jgi:hypothetical protein
MISSTAEGGIVYLSISLYDSHTTTSFRQHLHENLILPRSKNAHMPDNWDVWRLNLADGTVRTWSCIGSRAQSDSVSNNCGFN